MNVVFVEPSFPPTQRHFARALSDVGATVIGIGERPADWLTDVVRWLQSRLWVDRLETTIEAHTLPVAQVREACTIPGTSPRTAWLCRDKPSMKQALRAAGVPTAASAAAGSAVEVHALADAVGYPLI